MPELSIDFAGAQQIAAALRQNAADRQGELHTLGARVDPAAVWTGAAASAYTAKYEQWKAAETNLIHALEEMGQAVGQIISNFDEINQRGAAAFGG